MEFAKNQFAGLLNNVTLEKTKFITLLHKIKTLLALNKDHKLILNSLDKLLLTSSPQIIYENLTYTHPVLKILIEFLQKTRKLGNGDILFIEILKKLVEEVSFLLDNGVSPKAISNDLKDLARTLTGISKIVPVSIQGALNKDMKEYIHCLVEDPKITELLLQAIEYTGSFDTERIRICKVQAGSLEDSYRTDGMLINRVPEGRIRTATRTTTGMFNCPFDISRTEMKGTILMHTSEELLSFTNDEIELCKKLIDSLNVNVLIVSGNVNEMFVDFADSRNILVLRIFNKYDLKRICDLIGGKIYNTLGPVQSKGYVEKIEVVSDAGNEFTRIVSTGKVTTIVIKNSVKEVCDEVERKLLKTLETLNSITDIQLDSAADIQLGSIANSGKDSLVFTNGESFKDIAKLIGDGNAIRAKISEMFQDIRFEKMILSHRNRCVKYAFEFISTILEVDDYLVAKLDQLDVKPRNNPNWDDE